VGFKLKVEQGAGSGQDYAFETEAKLGRTADNDLVIKDASASRSHAKVTSRGSRFYVEDLASANGTELNGAAITGSKEIKSGDTITIGDVVLRFTVDGAEDADATIAPQGVNDTLDAPRPAALARRPVSTGPRAPVKKVDDETIAPSDTADTSDEPEAAGDDEEPAEAPAEEEDAEQGGTVPPRRSSLARAAPRSPAARPARAVPAAVARDDEDLTAAAKARQRRELQRSSGGKLQLAWLELPKPARIALTIFAAVFVLLGVGLSVVAAMPRGGTSKPEPNDLQPNGSPIAESFGSGNVTYRRSDMKTFTFQTASPTRVVGVLHYQAAEISTNEVAVSINGAELGPVPADTKDTDSREIDLVLPATALKRGNEENTLIFDNVNNPPNDDSWRIWNVWLEIVPVPEMSVEEAARRSQEEIEKASKFYESRSVGAENLFRAWKTYREAWLLLEATPEHPRELDDMARTRMRELRPELDRSCNALMVEYKKAFNSRPPNIAKARAILQDVPNYFPTREHPCLNASKSLLRDLDDWGE